MHAMNKIKLLSDLHMEGQAFAYQHHGEDAVLLLGDIHTRNRLHLLLDQIPTEIPVYFVAGNHEYYHGVFEEVKAYHRKLEERYNFYFLDNEQTTICGVPAYGGTMFSDWELDGPSNAWFAKHRAKDGIADFHCMHKLGQHYENVVWTVHDHEREHQKFVEGLQLFLKQTEGAPKRIVLSHFMPHYACTHERFRTSTLNAYFNSNMERFMGWDGYWLCGHGHDNLDVDIDGTRIIMNPRGYGRGPRQENPFFNPAFIIEV